MLFLIHYDRNSGSLVSLQEFSEKRMEDASSAKLELEISLLGGSLGHEVVLLEANSREDLKITHRRYFDTLQEMRQNSSQPVSELGQLLSERQIEVPDGFKVRKASPSDVSDVQRIQDRVFPPGHTYHYEGNIGVPGSENFVSYLGSEIVGFISVLMVVNNPAGPALWHRLAPRIGFVGVLPEYQKKGVFKLLLKQVLEVLKKESHLGVLYLECAPEKSLIYEKSGFEKLDPTYVDSKWGVYPRSCVMRIKVSSIK